MRSRSYVAGSRKVESDGSIVLRGRAALGEWLALLLGASLVDDLFTKVISGLPGIALALVLKLVVLLAFVWLLAFPPRRTVRFDRAQRQMTVSWSWGLGRGKIEWSVPFAAMKDVRLVSSQGPSMASEPRPLMLTLANEERHVITVGGLYANRNLEAELKALVGIGAAATAGQAAVTAPV